MTDELLVSLFYAAQGDITQFRIKARALLAAGASEGQASRERFEAHQGGNIEKRANGDYARWRDQNDWQLWQAAERSAADELAALRERIAGMEKDADAGKDRRFEIRQGGMTVAATEGPGVDAYRDAVHYFWQYQQDATEDEPVEMVELTTVMRIDTAEKQG
ncbi:hypothetical protein [Caballeronia zhejiangensis]|uniref:Uncharacterized protein n=1 Tax=Caballeronia zhejiangensis TaxID=871203 RepID=A0A656Q9Q9_9BURK|nr:hypothetical protein [Caballeronia zhejiangensis]KDR25477.1 hypothetical protein BG60_28485 [Caballeronia zhejiangensis]